MASSGYLVGRHLEHVVYLPLALPVTKLPPNSELTLGVISLASSQTLGHPYMVIKIMSRSPSLPPVPLRVNTARGYAFGALYDKNGVIVAGSETDLLELSNGDMAELIAPMTAVKAAAMSPVSGPASGSDDYAYKIVNNCQNIELDLTACGALKLDLSGS